MKKRLLELGLDSLGERLHFFVGPAVDCIFFLVLGGEAVLAESDDAEGGILVTTMLLSQSLEKTATFAEEGLSSLLSRGVDANAGDDVDVFQVVAIGKEGHGSQSSNFDVVLHGDVADEVLGFLANDGEEVQQGGCVFEPELEAVEDWKTLFSEL